MSTPTPSPGGDDPDTAGSAVPPYEGRRESADVGTQQESERDGAKVGGATGPVEDDEMKAAEPADTDRGATGSPADEQPAAESPETDLDDDTVGPAHVEGTPRGEDAGA
ncbi:MAG: hypothetical protein ACR2KG_05125 [Nocardioidaceae bacterium]